MANKVFLYDENFFFNQRTKSFLKNLLGRNFRGPQAVERSLLLGLDELAVDYKINQNLTFPQDTICVLSGPKVVLWAIKQKKREAIKRLVVGPNITVSVNDFGGLLKSPLIDIIIVPSQWVLDFYSHYAPEIRSKIRIWAAGVDIPKQQSVEKKFDFLIYNKIGKDNLLDQILKTLNQHGLNFKIVEYKKFNQKEYSSALTQSKYEIYLSNSESQGLAMFEAWARNVPTLVLETGKWSLNGESWQGQVSSPYLTGQAGERFSGSQDFVLALNKILRNQYQPSEYVQNNFSNKICAEKYLNIINA